MFDIYPCNVIIHFFCIITFCTTYNCFQGVKLNVREVALIFANMDINDSGAIEYEDFESFMEAHWERTCSRTAPLAPQRRLRSERLWKYYNEQQPLYELMPRSTEEQRRLKSQVTFTISSLTATLVIFLVFDFLCTLHSCIHVLD